VEQVVTAPSGATFLVRLAKPGDFGEYEPDDPTSAALVARLAVETADRLIHHGKWRVTVWPWPSHPSLHHPPISEIIDGEEAASKRAEELVEQIQQGLLRLE
jgi:hypothetical protein